MTQAVRVAAVGDLHCTKLSEGKLRPLFAAVDELADVLALCGDLTDYGQPEEARVLVKELAEIKIPIVAVLGNHDYESGHADEVTKILSQAGIKVLDGDSCEIEGIGFAGIKGFAGGFGRGTLGFWGEPAIKRFVQECIDESLKLESALARLKTPRRVALMHYSPIAQTLEGEPLEIYPYLGCSRLEEPLMKNPVDVVFHGHAHKGAPEGRTTGQTPVYNVALPLLRRISPERPFRTVALPTLVDADATRP